MQQCKIYYENPRNDILTLFPILGGNRFVMKKFHHVEFYCGDATTAAARFVWGLGMSMVAKSDQV